ncbi:MAG TPA: TIGR03435 family protein [Acidobacteriaceae bacterium]|nr:TIGR03435 family protein [Acidobacteriaceae bacterium]
MSSWCVRVVAVCVFGASGWAAAQGSAATADTAKLPTFDVISVKPSDPANPARGIRLTRDGITMSNMQPDVLLREGFQLGPNQLLNEPDWAKSGRWDISAKVASDDLGALDSMGFDGRRRMFVQLLTERFGLKYHTEKRELPVYALVLAKGGPKLTKSKPDPNPPDGSAGTAQAPPKGGPGKMMMNPGRVSASGVTLEFFASALSWQAGRVVVDKTGLTGRYDLNLTWAPEPAGSDAAAKTMARGPGGAGGPGGDTVDSGNGPSLFTAVQEQLGLKLEPQKAMVDVVVIDHMEKPSEN